MSSNTPEKPKAEAQFEKLLAEEKADKARQDAALKKQRGGQSRKQKILFGAVGGFAALLLTAIVIYDPFTGALRFGDGQDQIKGGGNQTVALGNDPFSWAKETGKVFPDATQPWEEELYWESDNEAGETAKAQKYWDSNLRQAAMALPSEAAGFTSDDAKAVNEDGTLNPMYSYWTQETFYADTIDILERFNNPVYGGWKDLQYSGGAADAYSVLSTMFSDVIVPETLANGTGIDTIPVLADWDANDYGMGDQLLTFEEGNRWLGTIKTLDTSFTFNDELEQYDVILTAKVTYSAWTKDKGTVTKDGTLTLNLGANVAKTVPTGNKVIVKSATLEF